MRRTRYGISPWLEGAPKKATHPALADDIEVPVAIIGGGLVGAATAYACAAAGVRVALLEADRIGHGASGRGPGLIQQTPPVGLVEVEARHGRRAAKSMWTAWRRATLDLAATVRRLKMRTGLTPADGLTWAQTASSAKTMEREFAARRAAGVEGAWFTERALAKVGLNGAGGIRVRGEATVDPVRLCQAFARAASARGAMLFERARAVTISPGRSHVEVECGRRVVRCDTVIVAAEPAGLFEPLVRHVAMCDSYVVQTAPVPAALRPALPDRSLVLQDCHQPPHRLAWAAGDRIRWTGADQPRTPERVRSQTLVQRTGQLMYELSLVLPDISGIQPEYGWDAPYSVGRDGLPLIGAHRNYPRHLFAFGLGTNPAAAFLASRLLLRQVSGTADKTDELFGFARLPR
jgi:glycine/D-amino acid oxidase-like deaminating enzyme